MPRNPTCHHCGARATDTRTDRRERARPLCSWCAALHDRIGVPLWYGPETNEHQSTPRSLSPTTQDRTHRKANP